jgi:hypothetical protein
MVNKPGYSFGIDYPIHCWKNLRCWQVFDARDMKILHDNIANQWDAMKLTVEENEKLGYGCTPDLDAIDNTP